uniref:26S proteasome regulatory subunit 4 homolog A-like n=1 Tax=Dermatophagoides pteronyssinus TaxID=6956 RepID=A0A6P6XM19_DERPT|nr:26S proteasome regulatory subunit 4 homolog A-like [Dermatophagoides pteronyssinus]
MNAFYALRNHLKPQEESTVVGRFPRYSLAIDRHGISTKGIKTAHQKSVSESSTKPPIILPTARCVLRQLRLERLLDWLTIERDYLLSKHLEEMTQTTLNASKAEAESFQTTPLMVGTIKELFNDSHAIVSTSLGSDTYLPILSIVDKSKLQLECSVLLHQKINAVVGVLENDVNLLVSVMKIDKAPLESFKSVGGLEQQIQELKEAVELPLLRPEIYDDIGIQPPKGVILYGPPGTGKTLLAKAVARETSATFLRIVGSELIQKYLGEGPKLVRELFKLARDQSPSIIFIDEIDAIGTKRFQTDSGGEKEIQRTMLELLNQLDGFDNSANVKVIMATNRIQSLDPALIRPGRIDRKIELPLPDQATKRKIFEIKTHKMTLDSDVNFDEFVVEKNDLNGAEIQAICAEAGLIALREMRMKICQQDFRIARERALYRKKGTIPESLYN